jgi:hypothetical protein
LKDSGGSGYGGSVKVPLRGSSDTTSVQESVLARSTTIMCREEEIDGRLVKLFTRWHHSQRWLNPSHLLNFDDSGIRSVYRGLNKWVWTGTLLETIDTFRGLQATDSRDKIYAILGLVQKNAKSNVSMNVDYHKSMSRVFYDAIYAVYSLGKASAFLFLHRPSSSA